MLGVTKEWDLGHAADEVLGHAGEALSLPALCEAEQANCNAKERP